MYIIATLALGLVAVSALGFFFSGQTSQSGTAQRKAKSSMKITGQEAKQRVKEGAFLLDVRTQQEFDERHLDGATLITVGELTERLHELPRDRLIIVYCQSGRRAARAVQLLLEDGLEAKNMGGIAKWPQP